MLLLKIVKSTHLHLFYTILYGLDSLKSEQVKKAIISSKFIEENKVKSDNRVMVARQERSPRGEEGRSRREVNMAKRMCFTCGGVLLTE